MADGPARRGTGSQASGPLGRAVKANARKPPAVPPVGRRPSGGGRGGPSAPAASSSSSPGQLPELVTAKAKAKPKPRSLQQKEGYSVMEPDKEKFKDLQNRQRLADAARPMPKPSDLRCHQVLDPAAAALPEAERRAARDRWIDEMQAKADPNRIRRAVREQEEQEREQERDADKARRAQFDREWHERQAQQQLVQQQRTSEVNAQARQHWAQVELPASQTQPEAVMPPEDVDFGAVRRRLAQSQPGGTASASSASASHRSVLVQEDSRLRSDLVSDQETEFSLCLLHDQLRDLRAEQSRILEDSARLSEVVEEAGTRRACAQQRLARYGTGEGPANPKLLAEAEIGEREEVLWMNARGDWLSSKLRIVDAQDLNLWIFVSSTCPELIQRVPVMSIARHIVKSGCLASKGPRLYLNLKILEARQVAVAQRALRGLFAAGNLWAPEKRTLRFQSGPQVRAAHVVSFCEALFSGVIAAFYISAEFGCFRHPLLSTSNLPAQSNLDFDFDALSRYKATGTLYKGPIQNTGVNGGMQWEQGAMEQGPEDSVVPTYQLSCVDSSAGHDASENCKLLSCPDTDPANATGYVWNTNMGKWECAPGYYGLAVRTLGCSVQFAVMRMQAELSGCLLQRPCRGAIVVPDLCRYNASDCDNMQPGTDCELPCQAPYTDTGDITAQVVCPVSNTDTATPPVFSLGNKCALNCEDPSPLPTGYQKVGESWVCATGFVGSVLTECSIDDSCIARMNFRGCVPLRPCAAPVSLDVCTYDVSACHGVQAGATCDIICQPPYYSGASKTASCPADNSDPSKLVVLPEVPTCTLSCPTPVPVPIGFSHVGGAWQCSEGWAGTARLSCVFNATDGCSVESELTGCAKKVVCQGPDTRSFDMCTYDVTDCLNVSFAEMDNVIGALPGTTCTVSCREPMVGGVAEAGCPADNTRLSTSLVTVTPSCFLHCPPPEEIPVGYIWNGNKDLESDGVTDLASEEWECAPGYGGKPKITCQMQQSYNSKTEKSLCWTTSDLSGCFPEEKCLPPTVDNCRHDVSDCLSVGAGESCQVNCAYPLAGPNATFTCADRNINKTQQVLGDLPFCVFPYECMLPDPLPLGYVEVPDVGWQCMSGYIGTPVTGCLIAKFCTPLMYLRGCEKLMPCKAPLLQEGTCGLDFDDCKNVQPGQKCQVSCLPGYRSVSGAGISTAPSCPSNNTDPETVATFVAPTCEFENCAESNPMLAGYVKDAGGLQCAAGYTGSAHKQCHTCNASFTYSGCAKLVPCAVPQPPGELKCSLDFSACSAVQPGTSCQVGCRAPLFSSLTATQGFCVGNNTDPLRELSYTSPNCTLTCPDPDPLVQNYTKVSLGQYACAVGYRGTPVMNCSLTPTCQAVPQLSGCIGPVPCSLPPTDHCSRFDIGACKGKVEPGEKCTLKCNEPFLGADTVAKCPYDNPDPILGLQWKSPRCITATCPEPIPVGYQKSAVGWKCAVGYTGMALPGCSSDKECCQVSLTLSGCKKALPCSAPQEFDRCMLDMSDCEEVLPGGQCEVRCKLPYANTASKALCSSDNWQPQGPLLWSIPDCRIPKCPAPSNVPAGYVVSATSGSWQCAPGYTGSALYACAGTEGPSCAILPATFSGCLPLTSCPLPVEATSDSCRLSTTCDGVLVPPGSPCQVSCRSPYIGGSAIAMCPANNTDLGTMAQIYLPSCDLKCPVPNPVPPGYEMTDVGVWTCGAGYTGTAAAKCTVKAEGCVAKLVLSGCGLLVPCLPPLNSDPCLYDLSDCNGVMPGESCQVPCRLPFIGGATRMRCPRGNTDPTKRIDWVKPQCVCGNPLVKYPEYVNTPGGWTCATGYVGTPLKSCRSDTFTECLPDAVLSGCQVPEPCGIGDFADLNGRSGFLTGRMTFGPAQVNGIIGENGIDGYQVFFADICGKPIGNGSSIASIRSWTGEADGQCCQVARYSFELVDLEVPPAATQLLIAITGGIAGKLVPLNDIGPQDAARVNLRGSARRMTVLHWLCMILAALATAPNLRPRVT
ncbi:unnamed protein product [Polarella glacialis]|uniref:Uncharacterized protein n=1 Tax=Polarella glacialis TaxID=89957 RepID=A0A813GYF0_POLGL|nr:unnamed protein product [Polarella glacialis]